MGYPREAPIRTFHRETPTRRRRAVDAVNAATQRAAFRFAVARLATATPGTLSQKRKAIDGAIRAGLIVGGRTPCPETIRQLVAKYEAGSRAVHDYRDDFTPRGPRPTDLPPAFFSDVKETAQDLGVGNLAQLVQSIADKENPGYVAELCTEHFVRRALITIGAHTISGARHGSRAATMDAMQRGTYPTKHTHEMWNFDEGDTRKVAQSFCRWRGINLSTRVPIMVIRDHKSGAFVSYHVVDPTRRRAEGEMRCMTDGFDSDDVMATLLSAACPELAAPGCEELAGYLPDRLRWDNANAHKTVEALLLDGLRIQKERVIDDMLEMDLEDHLAALAEEHQFPDLDFTKSERIQKRRPDRNGSIERMMPIVKWWTAGKRGCVDRVIPVDRLKLGLDLGTDRSEITAAGEGRQPRLTPVTVASLPTIDEIRQDVARAVKRYNEHVLRRNGMSPLHAARRFKSRHPRPGVDLIRLLGVQRYTVGTEGIEIERDGRSVTFAAINNGVVLQVGAKVNAYVDPLLRAAWLEQGRHLVLLRPRWDVANERTAADAARTVDGPARRASDEAADSAERRFAEEHGEAAATEAREAYEATRDTHPAQQAPYAPSQAKPEVVRRDANPVVTTQTPTAEVTDTPAPGHSADDDDVPSFVPRMPRPINPTDTP